MNHERQEGMERMLVNVTEAAEALGISPRTLWEHTSPRGSIPAVRIGKRVMYFPESLRWWIAKQANVA